MPLTPEGYNTLVERIREGYNLAVCEYLRVTWASGVIDYFGAAAWQDEPPFDNIGLTIQPRLMPSSGRDPFHALELNPDIRTESVKVKFDDIDKAITTRFRTYSSGVQCEFFLYYADIDEHVSAWKGQLQAPDIYGWKTLETTATNGFRSRELFIPWRRKPKECSRNVFGGLQATADAIRSALCPWDRGVGGSEGLLKDGTDLFGDCPAMTTADCELRFGHKRYYGGFVTDASPVITDHRTGYLAVSRGNQSSLKDPIRVVFGLKFLRSLPQWLFRRAVNHSTPDHGWVQSVWEVCEGPIVSIYNVKVNDRTPDWNQLVIRNGTRGQPHSGYSPDVSNFSGTAHLFTTHGWVNANDTNPGDLSCEAAVSGFAEVCVYTDDDPVTKTRIYSTNRAWCLLEVFKNQKWGAGYAETEFEIADWMALASWFNTQVAHVITYADGETETRVSTRSTFNAILEGRPFGEQVEDITRSGGCSLPFQHNGKFTIEPFRAATGEELEDAPVFTDRGQNVNIIWESGQPSIRLSQTPDSKIVNEVEVRFEEAVNYDVERSITVDDPNQKLKAGRQLGTDHFQTVPKRFSGFGINSLEEAIRLAYRLLWFGEFDEGGTHNNMRAKVNVPLVYALSLRRYQIIRLDSELLDGFVIGMAPHTVTPEYFRILRMKKLGNDRCELDVVVYNHEAYTNFETTPEGGDTGSPPPYEPPIDPPCIPGLGVPTYDDNVGLVIVPLDPC